jgi:hypothetical protein
MRHEVCKNAKNKGLFLQMPRITDTQTAVLNIMDYLFIHDVESLASFNDAKNTFNADLSAIIKRINSVRRNEEK